MADSKQSGTVRCVIVTPEATVFDAHARFVTLPLFDGERGVARGHAPFIGRLGAGEVRISGEKGEATDAVRRTFVEGGFVEVGHDSVTVITQRAIPGEKLSLAEARAGLEKLKAEAATGDEAIAAKIEAEATARALVRAAERRG
ncbi:MAG: FoF1 ATP synthase subunit delta/epsilon [Planctomycetia bacterium]